MKTQTLPHLVVVETQAGPSIRAEDGTNIAEGYFEDMSAEMVRRCNAHDALVASLTQLVAHFDSIITGEGEEFSCGAFDSVKDMLEDARKLLT